MTVERLGRCWLAVGNPKTSAKRTSSSSRNLMAAFNGSLDNLAELTALLRESRSYAAQPHPGRYPRRRLASVRDVAGPTI